MERWDNLLLLLEVGLDYERAGVFLSLG